MAVNKRLLQGAAGAAGGLVPSEHFGVVLYEGDGSTSHSINGGKFGAGAYFNGGSSFDTGLSTTNFVSDLNDRTVDFSFSCWAQIHSYPQGDNTIFYIGNYNVYSPNYAAIILDFRSASKKIRFTHQTQYIESTSTFNVPMTTWVHVAAVRDNSVLKLYINGSLEANVTLTANTGVSSSTTLDIGGFQFGTGTIYSGLEGKIDQVRIFQKALSSSEVSTLYAETVDTVESLDPLSEDTTDTLQVLGDSSCTALYRLENNEDDESGNYDATGRNIQYAAGRYGQAASFTGTNASTGTALYVSNNVYGSSTSVFSVSLWIKCTNTSGEIPISGNGGTIGGTQGYAMYLNSGSVALTFRSSNGNQDFYYGSSINDDSWHHLVLTFNNGPYALYLDGEVELSGTTTNFLNNTTPSFDTYFGNRWNRNESGVISGEIDQIRIFNKAISTSEVTTLYEENSLVASYRFEGNANDDTRNYDGTASNVTYEYGLNFTPDFVWAKRRSAAEDNAIFDTSRGVQKQITANKSNAESTKTNAISSFDSGGFTTGANNALNTDGEDYVAWCFKANGGTTSTNTDGSITSTVQANTDAGFSIVTYTGAGGVDTVGHGLSAQPELMFIKNRGRAVTGAAYATGINQTGYLFITTYGNEGFSTARNDWMNNDTPPTSSLFTVRSYDGAGNDTQDYVGNYTGDTYVAYLFHSVEGFSKIGSYTGTSADGNIIETGFEPAFIMIKKTSASSGSWWMLDNKRNPTNPRNTRLVADQNFADSTGTNGNVNFFSNGFELLGNYQGTNETGQTYIYMAFAADPDTEAPTVAKSFSTVTYTGTGTNQKVEGLGFAPNLVWIKSRSTTNPHVLHDTVRGIGNVLYSNLFNAEADESAYFTSVGYDYLQFGTNAGNYNNTGTDYVAWAWKADDNEPTINTEGSIDSLVSANANAGFSIVKWTANGSDVNIGHGLSAAPELIIMKNISSGTSSDNWVVGNSESGWTKAMHLDLTNADNASDFYWNDTAPTSTVFTAGAGAGVYQRSGDDFIAYCFHSVSGYSKIGSYSGNGSTQSITTGFQVDWLMLKGITTGSEWVIVDSVRGDAYLLADTNGAEAAYTAVDFLSTGFRLTSTGYNESGRDFIYMAFKIN